MVPSDKLQNRIDFYYGPYNGFYQIHKFMKFDDTDVVQQDPNQTTKKWESIREKIMHKDQELVNYFHYSVRRLKDQNQ